MLSRRALCVALAAALTLAATAGCVAQTPGPATSAEAVSPSASPLFASDEEALAAATEAYAAYLAASDAVGQGGWLDVSPIEGLAVEEALAADIELAETYRARGYLQEGSSTFDSLTIQSVGVESATTYLCLDVSQADLVDANGTSVVDRSQPRRVPLEVDFVSSMDAPTTLLVGRSDVWSGKNFC